MTAQQRRQAVASSRSASASPSVAPAACWGSTARRSGSRARRAKEEEGRLVARMLELVRQHPRLRLPADLGVAAAGGLAGQPQAGLPAVAAAGAESAAESAEKAAVGPERQQFACVGRSTRTTSGRGTSCTTGPSDGRPLKWFTLVDEYTRECLALEVERGMTAKAVMRGAGGVVQVRGVPAHPQRQRPGVHRQGDPGLAGRTGAGDAVHRAGVRRGRTATRSRSTARCGTSC